MKMVFPCCLVEKVIIDTHSPNGHDPCRTHLILVILYHCYSTLFGDYLHGDYPWTIKKTYIILASRSFNTSFQTFSFITRLSLLCGCVIGLKSFSRFMLWKQMDWTIPLRLEICHPKACLCFFSTSTSLFSSYLCNMLLMVAGFPSLPSTKT